MSGHLHQYLASLGVSTALRRASPSPRYTINSYPESLFPLPSFQTKEREQSDFFMSSTGQATSSGTSTSNTQLIIEALADYAKITGEDLSKNPFAATLEQSNSPEAILELLQEREKAFKEYRSDNRRLISCLSPAVKVLQAFSGILGEAVSLVGVTYHPAVRIF
jgi:hypothetical protein